MQEFRGIMAGIGDRARGINLIPPKMDADIYNFVIGYEKCIVTGFELNGNTLSPGTCVYMGYRGTLDKAITLSETNYIYGKFTINEEETDKFAIIGSNVALTVANLGEKFVTIRNGQSGSTDRHPYIYKAEQADTVIGVIESQVVATTQPENDNSDKVATTAYVRNQVAAGINYGNTTIFIYDGRGKTIGSVLLRRKAKIVCGKISITDYAQGYEDINFSLPEGFRPSSDFTFALFIWNLNTNNLLALLMRASTNGNCVVERATNPNMEWNSAYAQQQIGYEIN